VISAAVQVVGVASIAPLIGILSNPDVIQSNKVLNYFYVTFEFTSRIDFIIAFSLTSAILVVLSNFFSGLTLFLTMAYSVSVGSKLQENLFRKLLYRDFLFHKSNRYTESISLISQECPRFIYMILQQFLIMTSNVFIAVIIVVGLLFADYKMAIYGGGTIAFTYLVTYILIRNYVNANGKIVTDRNTIGQAIMTEAFKGIKDIKLRAAEGAFLKKFDAINHRGLKSQAYIGLAGDLPKLIIESACFCLILLFSTYLLSHGSTTDQTLTVLSLYAVAGYKLLPTGQQIYKAISTMSGHGSVVYDILKELRVPSHEEGAVSVSIDEKIRTLSLADVSFAYTDSNETALRNLTISFREGSINTIVGPSGSGKSTLIDLLLGLLHPKSGVLMVNGRKLNRSEVIGFRSNTSYVPQTIFITDNTVIANVAFGVAETEVDINRVEMALKEAGAIEFVHRLPQGLNTVLGQDGQSLSGGQRQRIGIARAFYNKSKVLVLDEPTSALDIESEYDLMQTLSGLKNSFLIVIVSHRPIAIKMSDNISVIKSGALLASGSYDELMKSSDEFEALMQKAEMA
jgi:ABC-type bacteriocin/lantibiotic exporter with double-glycine peptidase domain